MPPSVLIVSLDPALLETRHQLLLAAGYEAMKAANWADFEQACGTCEFDLILLGQTLPPSLKHDMDDFTKKHCPKTKVAEMYLHAQSIPAEYSFNANAADPSALLKFVENVLGDDKG